MKTENIGDDMFNAAAVRTTPDMVWRAEVRAEAATSLRKMYQMLF